MFELVLSGYMRDFFNRTGFEFTDFQKATLIWNAPYKEWRESLENLMELADLTSDEIVKKQIHERIAFEEKKYKMFQENSQKQYVYVVTDRTDNSSCGFFSEYNAVRSHMQENTQMNTKQDVQF